MKKNLFCRLIILFMGISAFAQAQMIANSEAHFKNNFMINWIGKTNSIDNNDTVMFDMSQAVCSGPYLIIPVSVISDDVIYAIDFSMKYDNNKMTFDSTVNCKPYLTAAANFNVNDSTLRFTSFSFIQPIEHNTPVASVRFNLLSAPVVGSDLNTVTVYLNGDVCSYKLIDAEFPTTTITPGGPTVFMTGDSVLLTANSSAGCTYLWSTGETTQTVAAYYTGTYTVTVTSAGGCNASASTNVYALAPLPIQLIDFTIKESSNSILISWITTNETNNNYFTIEQSSNAIDWQEIKKVNGASNANSINHYDVTDNSPLDGINYYRLKQTDMNGAITYYQPKSIFYKKQSDLKLKLYPNPATEIINIDANENVQYQLIDFKGAAITPFNNVDAGKSTQLCVSKFETGIYTLKFYYNNKMEAKNIVIKR